MCYKNQKQSITELRAWAKFNGYVMRKGNVNLTNAQAYRVNDKASNEETSPYFTLSDVTYLNNSDIGFCGLLYSHMTN